MRPADGRAVLPLDLIRGKRFAYNSLDSMSGIIALTRDLEAAGESLAIFSERIETGAHRASIVAVAEGRADVCAVDCRSWHLAQLHEPRAADVVVVGWTARRKGLPYITSLHTPPEIVAKLRSRACAPDSRPITSSRLPQLAGTRRSALSAYRRGAWRLAMSEQILLPMLGVFGPLVVATVVAYVLLNNDEPAYAWQTLKPRAVRQFPISLASSG